MTDDIERQAETITDARRVRAEKRTAVPVADSLEDDLQAVIADALRLREALEHLKLHGRINESMPGHEYGYTDNCYYCPSMRGHDELIKRLTEGE